MQRILVLRGGALGDFIVTLPALAALRERWPSARIELAGNATAAQLAVTRGLLDAAHSQHEARWARLFGADALPGDFAAWLAAFDLVLSYWPDPDGELSRRFPARPGQVFLSAPAQPARTPAAAHFSAPLQSLGLEPATRFLRLTPATASAPATGPIVFHPGSGSPQKNWPFDRWVGLIEEMPTASVILGDAELERWTPLLTQGVIGAPLINRPLPDLVELLARCRLYVGHDSGISHLAAACGARCVLLFGPTDPAMWAPPSPRVQVLQRGPTLDAIAADEVKSAIAAALADQT